MLKDKRQTYIVYATPINGGKSDSFTTKAFNATEAKRIFKELYPRKKVYKIIRVKR